MHPGPRDGGGRRECERLVSAASLRSADDDEDGDDAEGHEHDCGCGVG